MAAPPSRTECIWLGRTRAALPASSMRHSAGRSASSLATLAKPGAWAATASPRSPVVCAQRRYPAGSPSISVSGKSRLSGALPLRQTNGQIDAQRSNTPAAARNSANNSSWPCGVADAASSRRTCMRPPNVSTTCGSEGCSPPPRRSASALRLASPTRRVCQHGPVPRQSRLDGASTTVNCRIQDQSRTGASSWRSVERAAS